MSKRPTGFKSGDWLIRCDTCAFIIMASESRKRWDGTIVCKHCWEPRHPQEMLRTVKDRIVPPFIRPEEEGEFPPTELAGSCTPASRASYAICNCAIANVI